MIQQREPIRFLSNFEMDCLHNNALRILAEVGMKVDHDQALDYLDAVGCLVDRKKKLVRFPQEVAARWLARMKSDYQSRKFPKQMSIRYSHVRFRHEPFGIHPDFSVNAGGYCVYIYDLDGVRRPATLKDTRRALILADQLDQITYTGLPIAAQDVPLAIRQVRMAAELVKHTRKLGGIEALTPFDIEYIQRIGEVVQGGRKELKDRPVLIGYAEARSPLNLDHNMCDVLIEYVKRGMPQSLDTMPNAGLTAPVNPAGLLAVGLAETIAGLVLCFAVDPEAVVTLDITPSFADPSTGIYRYAGAERTSLTAARIQLISEYYGCPSGVHGGKTDALAPDIRSGMEKGLTMMMPILSGAVGIGTVGHIENAVTFSPIQLIIDNEIARYVRRAIRGFEISEEAVNFDQIRRIGTEGNYLGDLETAEQFRDFLNLSPFFTVRPWGYSDHTHESGDWLEMARQRVDEILSTEREPVIGADQEREVDEIVHQAEMDLKQKGLL